jgi:hypothetical protein
LLSHNNLHLNSLAICASTTELHFGLAGNGNARKKKTQCFVEHHKMSDYKGDYSFKITLKKMCMEWHMHMQSVAFMARQNVGISLRLLSIPSMTFFTEVCSHTLDLAFAC